MDPFANAPPTFAYVTPPRGVGHPVFQGENVNVRLQERIAPQGAPDPVRQSNFYADGKPAVMAMSMQQVALSFNIAGRQAVMEDLFMAGKYPTGFQDGITRGRQLPFNTRSNIERPTSQPFGDQYAVPGGSNPVGMVSQSGLIYNPSVQ